MIVDLPHPADIARIVDPRERSRAAHAAALRAEIYRRGVAHVRGQAAVELRDQGMSYRQIADEVGLSLGAVQRLLRQGDAPAPPLEALDAGQSVDDILGAWRERLMPDGSSLSA